MSNGRAALIVLGAAAMFLVSVGMTLSVYKMSDSGSVSDVPNTSVTEGD